MTGIAELLDRLLPCFKRLASAQNLAQRTQDRALDLLFAVPHETAAALAPEASELERRMLTLAQELTSWANKAAATNLAHILPGLVSHIPWLPQLDGACTTLAAMALLASKLDVQSSAAFRIVAACQLVFDVGRRVIAAKTAEVEAAVSAGIQPDQFLLLRLAILSDAQLAAVAGATRLLQQEAHSSAAAAFARSTARPSVLLPWMVAMLEGLALSTRTDTLQAADLDNQVTNIVLLANCVLTSEPFQEHAAAIAADSAVQDAIVGTLISRCLPHLVTAYDEAVRTGLPPSSHQRIRVLTVLIGLLGLPALAPAVTWSMQQLGAINTLRLATTVVAATAVLPADPPARLAACLHLAPEETASKLHLCAAQLLAVCCSGLPGYERSGAHGGGGGSGMTAGSSSSSTGGGNSTAVIDPATAQALVWAVVAAVPAMCGALRSLLSQAAADDADSLQGQAAVISTYYSVHKVVAANLSQSEWPARQLSAWAAAAEAILQLQPQLLQLDAALQHLGPGMAQQAAGLLATRLLTLLRMHWPPPEQAVMSGSRAGARAADLRRQLAQAHLAGCRLAHWLAQRAAGGQPAGPAHSRLSGAWWCWLLLICITKVFQPALMLSTSAPEGQRPDGPAAPHAQALVVAHAEATAVLASLAEAANHGEEALQSLELSVLHEGTMMTARAVSLLAPNFADVVSDSWSAALSSQLSCLPEGGLSAAGMPDLGGELLEVSRAGGSDRCVVALASSGLLAALLAAAKRDGASDEQDSNAEANRALAGVDAALLALADAADAALQGAASSGMPDGLQSQLRAAAASLREQRLAAVGGLAADAPPTERAAQMQQLLQPAADLAALMQQHYALPAIDKPHQLALAQAAAGRCCAYLRCANVEGEGGPAAGEGVGSKRCSACRSVWYCGTACSHADWREGGHRRVCKALGAARRAAKEAAAAAAAAAAAGQR